MIDQFLHLIPSVLIDNHIYLTLLFLGFAMGFVNSISGGGGVFGLPAFLMIGLPPIQALALNRIADIGSLSGALPQFLKAKLVEKKRAPILLILLLIGAILGVNVMANLLENAQRYIIFAGAVFAILLMILSDLRSVKNEAIRQSPSSAMLLVGFFLIFLCGIWNGALAMAGGTISLLVLYLFFGMGLKSARGTGMFLAIPETLFTSAFLIYYVFTGEQPIGDFTSHSFTILLSSIIGAVIGSKMMIKYDVRFIRGFICLVAVLIIARLVFLPL